MTLPNGFFAVSRGIFSHGLFKDGEPFSRREAWLWLVAQASWKPGGTRRRYGVVHLERGQLALTIREIAKAWTWSRSAVERALKEFEGHGMVVLGTASGTRNWVIVGRKKSHKITLITICNYNKYQKMTARSGVSSVVLRAGTVGQELPDLLAPVTDFVAQPTKQNNHESKKVADQRRFKPKHGAKGRGMIWIDHGTTEWTVFSDDFREVHGVDKLPESRIGGRGNWFRWLGEKRKA